MDEDPAGCQRAKIFEKQKTSKKSMSTIMTMTMTVSMDIEIKTKQNKHIFILDFISTGIVLLLRFIVNNFLIMNLRFCF